MTRLPDLAVFGAGSWGTALAINWARGGAHVVVWSALPQETAALAATRRHPRFTDVELPVTLRPVQDPAEAFKAPLWVSAMATQVSPGAWRDLRRLAPGPPEALIHCSKGILQGSLQTLSQALAEVFSIPVGVLSGPTFADEVSRNLPSAILLALPEPVPDARAQQLQALLATERLRVYLSRDVVGVELCAALKNILAIAAGLVDGMGLGHNARAALITRGLAEMSRLVQALGGQASTVMGLAGMGDLLLTATGAQSRNRGFGELVGRGYAIKAAQEALGGQVVEGMFTTEAALALAQRAGVELPIAAEVGRLLAGADPLEAVTRLMKRSLKSEWA
ncbi:MAG: NAD(P)-dependent glycerol-3-phosphate dehydrogenase [Acidobacteria bacterium]|nr:NAD(P)-dependent glycerol-3-phosphate dehydrogenase [Acidobacteriota bacterium]